jgi:heat-inducible transcriptional repressor
VQLTPEKRRDPASFTRSTSPSGQPVGSRALVERSALAFSASTVRGELAGGSTDRWPADHIRHTSAGRTPHESGYRLYAEELDDTLEGRPEALGVDLRSMRQRDRAGTPHDDGDALGRDGGLLALVSAPSLETASIRHIEVLTLQPTSVMVVVDHLHGRRHQAGLPPR